MAYINVKQENAAGVGIKDWIALNRWSNAGNYTVMTTVSGAATYTLETTIDQLNRFTAAEIAAAEVCPVENAVDQTVDGCFNITATPLEFIRINQTVGAGSVTMRVMQSGEHV